MPHQEINVGYRLSPQQHRLWTLRRGPGAYCAQAALAIERELDFAALCRALQNTIDRHEILRSSFRLIPGMDVPVQVVAESYQALVERVDLCGLSAGVQKERMEAHLREERERETDFGAQGLLLRASLLALAPQRHVLTLTLPSMCADAPSMLLLSQHIIGDYEAARRGEALSADVLQYSYYSEWQNELLEAEDEERRRAVEAWRKLETASSELKLPEELTPAGDAVRWPQILSFGVEQHVMRRVCALAERLRAAPSSVLLACWQSLLWRLSAEPRVTVLTAFDGRRHEALWETLGLLTKHLSIRCDFAGGYSFADAVRSVHASCLQAETRQQFYRPEAASTARGVEGGALPVGFEYARWSSAAESVKGQGFKLQQLFCQTDDFKIKLSCLEEGESLRLQFAYDPSVYQHAGVKRRAEEFITLLQSAIEAPESDVASLELLPEAERRTILSDWNATGAPQARVGSIKEAFEAKAAETPLATAVVYQEQRLSYAELNARANQLARHLRSLGVGPEVLVALCTERSIEMLVGVLGVLKAGGAYLPLSPTEPIERLAFMLDDAGARVLLTGQHLLARLPQLNAEVLCLDAATEVLREQSTENLDVEVQANHLAYVIYTSGTTGRPKGVMLRQGSVLNLFSALERNIYARHRQLERVSLTAPLAFDASVKQIIQLLAGRTLCIIPEEARLDMPALLAYLERQRIDVFDCTPSQLKLLLAARQAGSHGASASPFPRVVLVGGEPVDAQLWRWMVNDPQVSYYNLYGPTECAVDATARRVNAQAKRPTIGRPLSNVWIYILDERLQPVPVGVAGEIYIGGEGVGRGYLKRPDLTAEKFVPDPFASVQAARLYKTGDSARYLANGDIEFLGRLDNQIKVRGHRCEPEEIEAVISQHPSVFESAVVAKQSEASGPRLVAYVVPRRKDAPRLEGRALYTLPDGRLIAHLNKNETEYLYDEIFIKRAYLRHGLSLPPDACVFDVGANIGMFALFVAQQSAGAKVYAFEPLKDIFECLRLNLELYGGSFKAFAHGLSDAEKSMAFTYYRGYTMMSGQTTYADAAGDKEVIKSFLRSQRQTGVQGAERLLENADELLAGRLDEEREECRLRRLSDVIREEGIERIDLLKIDVQRAEWDVLRGIDDHDWPKIKQVVMEVHDGPGEASEGRVGEIRSLLESRGFRVVAEQDELLQHTDRWNLYAVTSDYDAELMQHHAPEVWRAPEAEKRLPPLVISELRKYLSGRLPEHMLPSAYTVLKELPLTRHGKVDRAALSTMKEESRAETHYVAPRNEVERAIAAVWRELLRQERVSIEERFFDIGGNSLLVIQMCNRLREVLGRDLPLIEVFSHPTIKSLAQYFSGERDGRDRLGEIQERAALRESSARRQMQARKGW